MRILLVTANYHPSVGGIERFVEHLAKGLFARGHDVVVVTATQSAGCEQEHRVPVVRIPSSDMFRRRLGVPYPLPFPLPLVRTLSRLLRSTDVVHAQDALYLTSVIALALAKRMHIPSVLTQHVGFVPQSAKWLNLSQRAAIMTIGRSSRTATVVASYNPEVAEWARRTWRLDEVRVLPVGVPRPKISLQERVAVRQELGLPSDAFVALFVGRDVPKKRLDVFLAAADPRYELVAVTDRRPLASPGTRIVPFMTPNALARLLAAADAFVLPSEAEGFPLALQEALVAGLPCVVTPVPGFTRFLREDEVIFVNAHPDTVRDALTRLASDRGYRQELAEKARRAGEREFGFDRFVEAYEDLYRELVSVWATRARSKR